MLLSRCVRSLFVLAVFTTSAVVTTASKTEITEKTIASPEQQNSLDSSQVASCPPVKLVENHGYHDNGNCDRAYFNSYKDALRRDKIYQSLKLSGKSAQVPNQKTVTCPLEPTNLQDDTNTNAASNIVGYDTVWMVENTASTPVVLAHVKKNGVEYSAVNEKITPPEKDPKAILKPGEWKALWTFEGHVFHAREMLASGTTGRVVLQHRTGLIPVGVGVTDMQCLPTDVEPMVNNTRAPEFARSVSEVNRRCNHMDLGFRNVANCPVNGYYIPYEQPSAETCKKSFKFHLGTTSAVKDFHWDWQSNTKFEGTAVGHSFAFYSAANPSQLVDTITLEPTRIIDCPLPANEGIRVEITSTAVLLPIARGLHNNNNNNNNATDGVYLGGNATYVSMEQATDQEWNAAVARYAVTGRSF